MPARKGNKHALKLKDPALRKKAYEEFCAWIASGKSESTFTFRHGDVKLTGRSVNKYIQDFPDELPAIHKEYAFAQGYAVWEGIVADSAKGINTKANTASLQMYMRSRFGWDKKTDEPSREEKERHAEDWERLKKSLLKRESTESRPASAGPADASSPPPAATNPPVPSPSHQSTDSTSVESGKAEETGSLKCAERKELHLQRPLEKALPYNSLANVTVAKGWASVN